MRSTPRRLPRTVLGRPFALVSVAFSVAALSIALGACSSAPAPKPEVVPGGPTGHYTVASGIHKIKHVIVIEQENRSLDSYFGTYPGADGIPMKNGVPTVCVPMTSGGCQMPYHDTADVNGGGPHGEANARRDVNGGAMNGFIASATHGKKGCGANVSTVDNPACSNSATPDVMGYHTAAEIPNYWTYAKDFALDDHMFEPVASWSLPDHLYLVSGWSAKCSNPASIELQERDQGPLHPGPDAGVRGPGPRHRHRRGHQRLDRHHLAPLQPACPVGLLRADRGPARLRRRLRRGVPAGGAELPHARHLEPAAHLRGRAEGPPAAQHPAAEQLLRRRQEGDAARGDRGSRPHRPTASTRPRASTRARPT